MVIYEMLLSYYLSIVFAERGLAPVKDEVMMGLDFNSLKTLKVLGEEKNTKRAAERLFVSQPAVSKALKKLREQFDDPLFTRRLHGLEPTPKCEALLLQLPDIIERLQTLFDNNEQFDPKAYRGDITVHINTILYHPMAAALFERLHSLAPNATIQIENWSTQSEHKLKSNLVDIGINFLPLNLSKEIIQDHVCSTRIKLCCRQDHIMNIHKEVTIEAVANSPLVLMIMPDYNIRENQIENYLKNKNFKANVLLRADKMDLCFDIVRKYNAVLPVSQLATLSVPEDLALMDLDKFNDIPDYAIGTFFSHKMRGASYQRWLNETIGGLIIELNKK